jgi:hypothetical protein
LIKISNIVVPNIGIPPIIVADIVASWGSTSS